MSINKVIVFIIRPEKTTLPPNAFSRYISYNLFAAISTLGAKISIPSWAPLSAHPETSYVTFAFRCYQKAKEGLSYL